MWGRLSENLQIVEERMPKDFYTKEDGLFLVDANNYIGVKVDSNGLHAINISEYINA